MGKPVAEDKPRRFPGQVRAIGAVLPPIVRPAMRSAGGAAAGLMADWPIIVGEALARVSTPRRLAAGTLTLGCSGPVALELQHLAAELAERINRHVGRTLVLRLRFVQEASHGRPAPPPRPVRQVVAVEVEGIPPGPLREALLGLGSRIASERA